MLNFLDVCSQVVQDFLTVVNDTLARRSSAAVAALDALESKRNVRPTAAIASSNGSLLHRGERASSTIARAPQTSLSAVGSALTPSRSRPNLDIANDDRGSVSPPPSPASSPVGVATPDFSNDLLPYAEDEEAALADALRWVSLGFPGYEPALWLGKIEAVGGPDSVSGQLCLLLLPRGAPPNPDGSWPFYLPYNARPIRSVSVSQFVTPLVHRNDHGLSREGSGYFQHDEHGKRVSGLGAGVIEDSTSDRARYSGAGQLSPRAALVLSSSMFGVGKCSSISCPSSYRAFCGGLNWLLGPLLLFVPSLLNRRAFASLFFVFSLLALSPS